MAITIVEPKVISTCFFCSQDLTKMNSYALEQKLKELEAHMMWGTPITKPEHTTIHSCLKCRVDINNIKRRKRWLLE